MKALVTFNADNNGISTLQAGIFNGLRKLQTISIKSNRIDFIDPMLFSNATDLTSLNSITLESNQLESLEPWPIIRAQTHPGFSTNLAHNRIHIFQNSLNWKFKCGRPSVSLYLNLNFNKVQRLSDMVNGWDFERFVDAMCAITSSWWPVGLLSLYDNPFICDCKEFMYLRFFWFVRQSNYIDSTYCAEPVSLVNTRTTSVPLDRLFCGINDTSCPQKCACSKQLATLTINVDCSEAGLSDLPSEMPPIKNSSLYRYNLTFSGNNIETVNYRRYMKQTSKFRISGSGVRNIDEDTWTSFAEMDAVDLSANQLVEFPAIVKALNFSETILNLANNSVGCECNNKWTKSWLISLKPHFDIF